MNINEMKLKHGMKVRTTLCMSKKINKELPKRIIVRSLSQAEGKYFFIFQHEVD
jgi:hypothetical protein